jgi:hypothetical protein
MLTAIAILAMSVEARAQSSNTDEWHHGTTLAGFFGVGSVAGTKPAVGTTLGWDLTPRLTLEGRGVWFPEDRETTDFYAWFGALAPFRPAAAFVPFASAGIGMYRATVDASVEDIPAFYEGRMENRGRATFQDFSLAFGGGVDIFVTSHVAIRPEVNLLLVMAKGQTLTAGLYGVQVAYHFEPHKPQ